MIQNQWLSRIRSAVTLRSKACKVRRTSQLPEFHTAVIETLESRVLLSSDFGDAPDTSAGTGTGNYNTLTSDGGPSHTIVAGLFMGAGVDGEADAFPTSGADGDDVDLALPDDEDGLTNPSADLVVTFGANPTVDVTVTNATGSEATLYGWIDYNADGAFDNITERASVVVPDATDAEIVTLVFPLVPFGFTGTTYARFRLSTDAAAADATGAASDGEVEDYTATIRLPGDGIAKESVKIAHELNGGPTLGDNDRFGISVAALGDLDGDGVADMAVGARYDDTAGDNRGAVYVQFMNADGTVDSSTKLTSGVNGAPVLADGDQFGISVVSLGDLNGDGVTDMAVGAFGDDTGGVFRGAVYVLFMNSDGTVDSSTKIANDTGGGPTLPQVSLFGTSLAALGDIDGDGIGDLAVGAVFDAGGGVTRGAVYVLLMNADGTAKSSSKIGHETGGGPTLANGDRFARSLAALGDLDGDGIGDLAVGAYHDDTGGVNRGAVYVLLLDSDGSAKDFVKVASGTSGGPVLVDGDRFGSSVTSLGDFDGDGVVDLAVGARDDNTGGTSRGAVYLLFMNTDGTVADTTKIADGVGGGPSLNNSDGFGSSVAALGDLDGDGIVDLAVGARGESTAGIYRGAVHVLFMNPAPPPVLADIVARDAANGQWRVALSTGSSFETETWGSWNPARTYIDVRLVDVNGDGLDDLIGRVESSNQWQVSLSTGSGFSAAEFWATWSAARTIVDVLAADFNGDGMVDIAGRDADSGLWRVNLSTETAFGPTEFWTNWNPTREYRDVHAADFDGDGLADIAGRDAASGLWRVNLSTGSSFTATAYWTDWNPTRDFVDVQVADFNGDGLADIAGRDAASGLWRVNLSTGSGFTPTEYWTAWNPTRDFVDVIAADFNGDGRADIAGRDLASGLWRVSASTGSAFAPTEYWTDWNPTRIIVDVQAADFNGDAKIDLAGRDAVTGVWRVSLSTGSSFATTEFWESWSPNRTYVDTRAGNVDAGPLPPGDSVSHGGEFVVDSGPQDASAAEALDSSFAVLTMSTSPGVSAANGLITVASLPPNVKTPPPPIAPADSADKRVSPPLRQEQAHLKDTDEFFALAAVPENADLLAAAGL